MIRDGAERAVFDIAKQPVPFYDVSMESCLGGFDFKRLQLGDMVMKLLLDTTAFRLRAHSYRNFLVGAGASFVTGKRYGRTLGYNVKPQEGDDINIHAEDLVVCKSEDYDADAISVLTVIGWPQADKITGRQFLTLPPCGQRCRPQLAVSPLIKQNTLIAMATPDFKVISFTSIYGVIRSQDYDDQSHIKTFSFERTPAVLEPLPEIAPGTIINLMDYEVDSTDWDDGPGLWLSQRFADTYENEIKLEWSC